MKTKLKLTMLAVAVLVAASSVCYAESAESAGGAVANGLTGLIKAPVTILHKMQDMADKASSATSANEDVAVAPVYDLDAETTG